MIASLTGPDNGPSSQYNFYSSHWQKKIISSSSNKMLVEFRSNDVLSINDIGFSATIHYSPLPSNECEKGLDMTMKTIQSPNYADLYDNNLACKWLISVPYGSHIMLKFLQFDVRFSFILISDFFLNILLSFSLQLEDDNDFLSIHDGGSDDSEMVKKLTGTLNGTKISIPGNQMFVVFQTNEEIVRKGFHALIIESKYLGICYLNHNKLSEIG